MYKSYIVMGAWLVNDKLAEINALNETVTHIAALSNDRVLIITKRAG